ncbi:MAG: single-stranded DNA-binding protein [Clostridia bacterium]|nr:single-stranded DNA-binding protein [Clostridia bacterium]
MLNKVVLIGRLTRDPELRYTTNGISVATFTLAVERTFANSQGQRETDFIPIVTWRKTAELCAQYLSKGRMAGVSGRIQTRSYENQEGQRRYVTEIVADEVQFLGGGGESRQQQPGDLNDFEKDMPKNDNDDDFMDIDNEEDLPF